MPVIRSVVLVSAVAHMWISKAEVFGFEITQVWLTAVHGTLAIVSAVNFGFLQFFGQESFVFFFDNEMSRVEDVGTLMHVMIRGYPTVRMAIVAQATYYEGCVVVQNGDCRTC